MAFEKASFIDKMGAWSEFIGLFQIERSIGKLTWCVKDKILSGYSANEGEVDMPAR